MNETPEGTPVGVDDPYDRAGACDHVTSDGRCRFALDRAGDDPGFAAARRAEAYACVAAADDRGWRDCPHYRSTTDGRECARCGLPEVRMAHDDDRPLIEEHHLSYGAGDADAADADADPNPSTNPNADPNAGEAAPTHEITVALCRWCHAKVHRSIARIDDDASPAVDAVAERERRRGREAAEFGFASAAERRDE